MGIFITNQKHHDFCTFSDHTAKVDILHKTTVSAYTIILHFYLSQRRTEDGSSTHTRWPTRKTGTGANLHTKVLDALAWCFPTH